MRVSSLNVISTGPAHLPEQTKANLEHTLDMFAYMIPHLEVVQETKENIDTNVTMVPTGIVKAIKDTAHDRLVAFRNMNHETRIDSEITRTSILTTQA